MRVTKFLAAASLVAGMAFFAQSAHAGAASPLADGFWVIENANDPNNNTCETGSDGSFFETFGSVFGSAQKTAVEVRYDTPQATSASRNQKSISAKQGSFSTLNVLFNGTTVSGGDVVIQKCSVSGSVNTVKATGSCSVSCSGDDITQVLDANEATLTESAFASTPNVKFKVNVNNGHWSLKIKTKGDATAD
jgi:hypothetical protein